ncbi:MAG: flagellar basal body L-ring protein FlgH [bacterium]|nr:flagellar basal body L-ring protein FlgH [bacterium]
MEKSLVKIRFWLVFKAICGLWLACILGMSAGGCSGIIKKSGQGLENGAALDLSQQEDDSAASKKCTPSATSASSNGSLWSDSSSAGYLFVDPRARAVGDIVTVNIVERASASGNASTKAGRKSSVSADVTSLLGLEKSAASRNPNLDPTNLLSASASNSFDGSGEISRSGRVSATLSARVIRVLPNRNLLIRGTRQVTINNEQQLIVIQGIIRPEDIAPDNTVSSTSIADAQIAYTGRGVMSEKQHPGWLSRIIDLVWPF